jgi:hypothetical protein
MLSLVEAVDRDLSKFKAHGRRRLLDSGWGQTSKWACVAQQTSTR